ncbi:MULTISPECIES: cardiolipin synthase [unclassified Bacillus (in: firmicutes)]|uniref:cardiolipin synthase n=1 Tax=unclassified Bacillus (in: firmicutes) TaxID=185979 RepID=UPI0008EA7825|nr:MULTISPECIES: cardiolipin synthase [unclassified Bacillus (in: firmicutes)]SFB03473.1 cardiolipin synthase [Bacillus sp. UNCCL13]SFQ88806.1 cardiolipin synthase [Bacillus sp. cl95]
MNAGWIIAIILFMIAVWLPLDFALGRKKHRAALKRKDYPIRMSDIDIFTHGKTLFSSYFGELKNAKHHIHVLFYIVKEDDISEEFLSILEEKAKAGVEVRLLLDWLGSWSVKKKTVKRIEAAGIKFAFCHKPQFPFVFYTFQTRNHRKITIIDGKVGFLGGYNVGKEYIDQDPKLTPWRDYHLKITGEAVQDIQHEFLTDWQKCAKVDLFNLKTFFPALEKGSIRHQILPTEGFELETTFSGLISKAEKSITIGSPYFIPSKKVMAELMRALHRGVEIQIIVPAVADHILVREASFPYFRKLLREGATVYQYMKGFYHAKVLIIDDYVCDIGTANFDKRSFFLNHEINCFIYDFNTIQKVKDIIAKDILDSQKLTLKHLNKPNLLRSIKEAFSRLFLLYL